MKRVRYNRNVWEPWNNNSRKLKYTDTPILVWLSTNIGPISKNWKPGGNEWIYGSGWAMGGECSFAEPKRTDGVSNIIVDQWVDFNDDTDDELLFEFALKFS